MPILNVSKPEAISLPLEGELTITIAIKQSFFGVQNRPNNDSLERFADVSRKIMTAILIL